MRKLFVYLLWSGSKLWSFGKKCLAIYKSEIERISSEFIGNVAEISFRMPTSKRRKTFNSSSQQSWMKPSCTTFISISSLAEITAILTIFMTCSIITREPEHQAKRKYPDSDKMNVVFTPAAFIALNIFEAFFSEVVFSDLIRIRSKLQYKTESIFTIHNKLKYHISLLFFPSYSLTSTSFFS